MFGLVAFIQQNENNNNLVKSPLAITLLRR